MSNLNNVDDKDNYQSLRRSSLSIKMQRSLRKVRKSIQKITESILEDDKHSLYIFPEQLSILTWRTGFSKDEIRKLYHSFKQLCPRGCAMTGDLKSAYTKLFPLGDPAKYAQIVFNSFDKDGDGIVNFSDLLRVMTLIINGNMDQKLSWIFELYDLNGDGCITRQEMLIIISAIYEMVQDAQNVAQSIVDSQVDRFFEKMDANRDGVVSREEFMSGLKMYGNMSYFML
ncbi:neuronal calcium sensor 1-like [Nylanderia fulva]|uniref:neuronal calcium sensor 1-like n=1 Tax=Nylanderia fulva TaxID=613905 RepID=UPI0010FAE437|nr:neuronal calcium sensor 1-like [Nylanderia fulva]XP_029164767.1 neuronal calcium sensor 1-like [Nylanderia fulva]